MNNYIVRIYPQDEQQETVAGIVEVEDTREKRLFKNHDELLAILNEVIEPGVKVIWEPQ